MIAVHAVFYTKWRRVTKRRYRDDGTCIKYRINETAGLEQRGVKHLFIESGGQWKAPCGATTKQVVGTRESFDDKIRSLKEGYRPCKKCRAWLEKNEAGLKVAEALS